MQSPVEMVQWLGAVQAQEYAQTKWGIGLRLPHVTDADIDQSPKQGIRPSPCALGGFYQYSG